MTQEYLGATTHYQANCQLAQHWARIVDSSKKSGPEEKTTDFSITGARSSFDAIGSRFYGHHEYTTPTIQWKVETALSMLDYKSPPLLAAEEYLRLVKDLKERTSAKRPRGDLEAELLHGLGIEFFVENWGKICDKFSPYPTAQTVTPLAFRELALERGRVDVGAIGSDGTFYLFEFGSSQKPEQVGRYEREVKELWPAPNLKVVPFVVRYEFCPKDTGNGNRSEIRRPEKVKGNGNGINGSKLSDNACYKSVLGKISEGILRVTYKDFASPYYYEDYHGDSSL
ncbi:MAG: hypothetical protein A2857_04380 [Candidatus Levybacteria bacterium RIFCSPHIGHO2_01_FULL_36_15]|nr:MAG: hypothetical protein A2857_04380 [Candidatus Levybacteria bacterium RIFCSPHIGHO2_01_FULL_36_15]OGH37604.1 MAG: hypothetical protein A2905_04995 [Candidatus Levybacteria bacterium RIFCSPLOWO2_01_FULL_36_10]